MISRRYVRLASAKAMFYLGARGDGDAIDAALALCCDQEVLVRREAAKLLAVLPTKGDAEVKHRIMGQFRLQKLAHQNDLMPPICQVQHKGDSLGGENPNIRRLCCIRRITPRTWQCHEPLN